LCRRDCLQATSAGTNISQKIQKTLVLRWMRLCVVRFHKIHFELEHCLCDVPSFVWGRRCRPLRVSAIAASRVCDCTTKLSPVHLCSFSWLLCSSWAYCGGCLCLVGLMCTQVQVLDVLWWLSVSRRFDVYAGAGYVYYRRLQFGNKHW
jgi:hypothetical protein